jgi:hypothetical protein
MTTRDTEWDAAAKEWRRLFHAEADAFNALVIARCNFHREVEAMDSAYEAVRLATKRLVAAQHALVEHVKRRRGEGAHGEAA